MADRSKGWVQAQRERIEASKAMPYLLGVVDGTEEPEPHRIKVALALLAKRLPDQKPADESGDQRDITAWQLKL